MFESVIEKFNKYVEKKEQETPINFNLHLAMEVQKRLEQLDYLYKKVMKRHLKCMRLVWIEQRNLEPVMQLARETGASVRYKRSDEKIEINKLMFEIELLTESFYYMAFRMRQLLKHNSKPLPELHKFECVGVRNVRNKLIEHPEEKGSGVILQSFGVGGEQGPTLKVERPAGQENIFPDAGLKANSTEIRDELERLLDQAIT